MPGPKPDAKVAFERIYNELSRLYRASKTTVQMVEAKRLIDIMRDAEFKWIDPVLAMPPIKPKFDQTALNAAYMEGFVGNANVYATEPELEAMWIKGKSHREGRNDQSELS